MDAGGARYVLFTKEARVMYMVCDQCYVLYILFL